MTSQPLVNSSPTCILNGHSVHVEEAKTHIGRIARELGTEVQVVVTKRGDDISALAARALDERRHPIVAGGGDGTINAVAGKLAGTDTPLGVLPMGTLNHFAKDAGIPLSLEAAVRNLFTGQVTKWTSGRSTAGCSSIIPAWASIRTSSASVRSKRNTGMLSGWRSCSL
jgi:diacylglycerol kinase family enzyme